MAGYWLVDVRDQAAPDPPGVEAVSAVHREHSLLLGHPHDLGAGADHQEQEISLRRVLRDVTHVAYEVASVSRMSHERIESGRLDPAVGRDDPEGPPQRAQRYEHDRKPGQLYEL